MLIETRRLQLRPLDPSTATAIATRERPAKGWAEDFPTDPDVNIARLIVDGVITVATDERPWGPYVIVDRTRSLAVGGIGFKGAPSSEGAVEVGYGVCPTYRRQGIATEALVALVDVAHERGVATVVADTEVANVASQRVLAGAGFTNVGSRNGLLLWRHPGSREPKTEE